MAKKKAQDPAIVLDIDRHTAIYAVIFLFLIIAVGLLIQSMYVSDGSSDASIQPTSTTPKSVVSTGDTVLVSYTGRFQNGSVFDTSNATIAQEVGIYTPQGRYAPIPVTVGSGATIPGFEAALIGMRTGESKTITLSPQQAFGLPSPENLVIQPRTKTVPRQNVIPRDEWAVVAGDDPVKGDVVALPDAPWNLTVTDVNDSAVTVESNLEQPVDIATEFGTAHVTPANDSLVISLVNVSKGIVVPTPAGVAVVSAVTEDNFTLDYNHPLAGETLVFDLTVEDIQPA